MIAVFQKLMLKISCDYARSLHKFQMVDRMIQNRVRLSAHYSRRLIDGNVFLNIYQKCSC